MFFFNNVGIFYFAIIVVGIVGQLLETPAASDPHGAPAASGPVAKASSTQAPASANTTTTAAGHDKPKSAAAGAAAHWDYNNNNWGGVCSTGNKQSPIELTMDNAVNSSKLTSDPLVMKNYNKQFTGTLTNNGHTVVWNIDQQVVANLPTISGSGLGATSYVLDQFLFHWGSEEPDDSCVGSEHVIDYRPAPLEVQFVHHNTKYNSFDEAADKSDGLAVIGILFKPVRDDARVTNDYSGVTNMLTTVPNPTTSSPVLVDLGQLMPNVAGAVFFRYDGSLTTPSCSESVTWTVFRDRVEMPESKLKLFRRLLKTESSTKAGTFETLDNNYRPIQPLNGRIVWTNGNGHGSLPSNNAVVIIRPSSSFLLLIMSTFAIISLLLL